MRDFEKPGRSEALGTRGMAATSHPAATLAAIDTLRNGGNAVDAAVTAAALLAVVEPTQTGIGGDCFVLLKRDDGPVIALNGSGWAPAAADLAYFRARGLSEIAPDSVHAVTVPGAIGAWERIVEDHGTQSLDKLLAPALRAARDGYPVMERVARDWARQVEKLAGSPQTANVFLSGGAAPAAGTIHRQPALAKTLKLVATGGAKSFYEGAVAEAMVTTLRQCGGLHRLDDFASYRPHYVDPISTPYRGYELWECPPNGQGLAALVMAAALQHFPLADFDPAGAERLHLQAEIARIAYAERDLFIGDPSTHWSVVADLLAPARMKERLRRISLTRRCTDAVPIPLPAHRDTTFVAIVDRDGTAVSFINSIFDDFGSGILCESSGVLFHNRGMSFSLEEGHRNAIAGRKRPMHTIIPALVTEGGRAVMPFGVTGAHFQPLGQIQVLANIVDYGMSVQAAVDFPRMFARGDVFEVERAIPDEILGALRALGHMPVRPPNPLGTAQAIWIDRRNGVLRGGADSRRDGIALGY